MDIPRKSHARRRRILRIIYGGLIVIALVGITLALRNLRPAPPSVERTSVWIGVVKRGPMVRQVRGPGTLVPEDIRWVAAQASGRVERRLILPGANVGPDTILIELSNPRLQQEVLTAHSDWKSAESDFTDYKVKLEVDELNTEARLATLESDYSMAKLKLEIGADVARVANPAKLKAELKIMETQAKDVQIGQIASIDTRNGLIAGRVIRKDPTVLNGTVTVDVALEGDLPRGAIPDLSVDGTIELERLDEVVYMERPTQGQEGSTIGLFKLTPGGREAVRVQVRIGRVSVSTVEILSGLVPGEQVILSDMTAHDDFPRIRLN